MHVGAWKINAGTWQTTPADVESIRSRENSHQVRPSLSHLRWRIRRKHWQADHVLALTATTTAGRDIENYLPAHRLCNQYRCNCFTQEVQWILKIGTWARTQMERKGWLGQQMCEAFVAYEAKRELRRKPKAVSAG